MSKRSGDNAGDNGSASPDPDGTDREDFIDPGSAAADAGPAAEPAKPRKRRSDAGIPRAAGTPQAAGGAAKAKTSGASLDLTAYLGLYIGLHAKLAALAEEPGYAVTEAQGKAFLGTAQNAARHFNIPATQKAIDIASFVFCAGAIYGPMAGLAIRNARRGPQPRQRPPQANGEGASFPPAQPAGPTFDFSGSQMPPMGEGLQ